MLYLLVACTQNSVNNGTAYNDAPAIPKAPWELCTAITQCCLSGKELCKYNSEDVPILVENLKQNAAFGDSCSQLITGYLYYDGECSEKNIESAQKWFSMAAANGQPKADMILGYIYAHGKDNEPDYQKAYSHYEKAAARGDTDAMIALGNMHIRGQGVKMDFDAAFDWYKKAADLGSGKAYTDLGKMFRDGLGTLKDLEVALRWYEKAAETGDYVNYKDLVSLYSDEHLQTRDPKRMLKWIQKAAYEGDRQAQYKLGRMHQWGRGVKPSSVLAMDWYKKAALQGSIESVAAITELYNKGITPSQKKIQRDENQSITDMIKQPDETGRSGNFISYSDGTVVDTDTNLMWASSTSPNDMNWLEAMDYCYLNRLGGYTNWRMPTRLELAHLYNAHHMQENSDNTELPIKIPVRSWSSFKGEKDLNVFSFRSGHSQSMLIDNYWQIRALPVRSIE